MPKLRILYLYPYGGANPKRSSFVMGQGILAQLLKKGHTIYVAPSSQEELELANALGLNVLQLDRENLINRALGRLLLVQINSKRVSQLAVAAESNDVDVILERHSLVNKGVHVSAKTGIPYVTNEVIVQPDLAYYTRGMVRLQSILMPKPYIKRLERNAFLQATAIVGSKEVYIDTLVAEYGIPPQKFFRFRAMVDKYYFAPGDRARACRQLALDESEFVITYVGSFDRLHTPELLVTIIKHVADLNVRFVLVGDGPSHHSIMDSVRKEHLESKVIFTGRVGRDEVLKHIHASDLCIDSIWNNRVRKYGADSTKIYEYMACGKAVITSDLPGQIQELRREGAGILVDPSDVDMFANAIRQLYGDRRLCKEMGGRARRLVEDTWNWDYTGTVIDKALNFAVESARKDS